MGCARGPGKSAVAVHKRATTSRGYRPASI
jgi:hypothetical protein